MASLKEDVNSAFQRITNNPYAYVSHPEVLALIEALSPVAAVAKEDNAAAAEPAVVTTVTAEETK